MSENRTDQAAAGTPGDSEGSQAAIEALRREADDNRDKYLRLAAELDNLRKRSAREVEAARKFGAERLAQSILPVRDSLEAALAVGAKGDGPTLLAGQQATLRLVDEALLAAGIREIDPKGEPFDPTKHEALSMLPVPRVAANTVLEVVQKGYEMNDRLLRAAKVVVARGDSQA